MRNPSGLRLALATLLLIVPAVWAWAENEPCSGSNSGPSDASLQLSLKDGRSSFREGEIITLQLAFASTAKEKYQLSTRNYDRSGRMDEESFCLTRPWAPTPWLTISPTAHLWEAGLAAVSH